ncbi:MAG: helix-turn-helix transcriptional regulator [Pseudomonadota bacterium]
MTLEIAFGKLLKEHRVANQFTQADLALRAGVTASLVTKMERGTVCPTLDTVFRISSAFDVRPEVLVAQLHAIVGNRSESSRVPKPSPGLQKLESAPNARTLLAANVLRLRTKIGISQDALAELAGFHELFVGKVERGVTNITADNVQKLADALSVPVSKLFESPVKS